GRADGVLAFQHASDPGLPDRQRAKNKGAERNRLVAGHAHPATQRPRAARGQGRGWNGLIHGRCPRISWTLVPASYHGGLADAIDSGLASGQGKHHFFSSSGPTLRISEPWQNPSSARNVSVAVA